MRSSNRTVSTSRPNSSCIFTARGPSMYKRSRTKHAFTQLLLPASIVTVKILFVHRIFYGVLGYFSYVKCKRRDLRKAIHTEAKVYWDGITTVTNTKEHEMKGRMYSVLLNWKSSSLNDGKCETWGYIRVYVHTRHICTGEFQSGPHGG